MTSLDKSRDKFRLQCAVAIAAVAAAAIAATVALASPAAAAHGPDNIADVAEQVIDAVVNVSTSQKVDPHVETLPDVPPGSPMEEFFDQFFKNHRGQGGGDQDQIAASGDLARLGLHHRPFGRRRDQQSRHRRRRRDQCHPQ